MLLRTGVSFMTMAIAATAATAQSPVPATPAPTRAIGAPGDAGSAVTDTGVADIVVTAQRRAEPLQRTALAVSAVDGAAIRNAGISQPQDLTKLIPALQLAPLGGGGTQVTIRGVGNFAPFLYSEPAVAINYDGVYLARSAAPNGLFFDLARVEVLKGPQGTLYGRNATGGAVNVISNRPELGTLAGGADVEFGSYDLKRGSGFVNVPLGSKAALRIAGQVVDRSGYLSDGYLDDKGEAVRGQLLVVPTERLKVDIEADYIHQGGKGPGGVFVTPGGFLVPSDPYRGASSPESNAVLRGASLGITGGQNPNFLPPFGTDGYTDLVAWGTSATIDYDLDFAALTFIPAFRQTDNHFKHYVGGFPLISTEHSEQTTLELRLASPAGGKFKWVVGGYYFDDRSNLIADASQGVAHTITIASDLPVRSAAGFGQATYSLTDRFRVTAGIRYTNERKRQTGVNISDLPPVPTGFPAPAIVFYNVVCPAAAGATLNVANKTCTGPFNGNVEFNRVTWKGGVEFDAGPQSLLYASAEQGFKAGGFYPSLAPNTFKPEKIFAVTLGSKNRFFGNALQLNLEAFYWKYSDKQVSHLGPLLPEGYAIITENAGKATIYGAEADLTYRPSRADRLNVNLQYVHSRYDTFVYNVPLLGATARAAVACPQVVTTDAQGNKSSRVDCAGFVLPQTPEFTLNASYQHTFGLGQHGDLDAIAGIRAQSSFFTGEEFLPGQFQTDSTQSYASLTYRAPKDRFSIGAFVDNIEGTAIKASSFVQPAIGIPVVVLRPPRTYGIRAGVRF